MICIFLNCKIVWLTILEKWRTDYFGRCPKYGLWRKNRYLRILVGCIMVQNFQNWSKISLILSLWGLYILWCLGLKSTCHLLLTRELLHISHFSFAEIEWLILQSLDKPGNCLLSFFLKHEPCNEIWHLDCY